VRALLDGFHGKLRDELSGAEGDRLFVPPQPAVVDCQCSKCGGRLRCSTGVLVLACRV